MTVSSKVQPHVALGAVQSAAMRSNTTGVGFFFFQQVGSPTGIIYTVTVGNHDFSGLSQVIGEMQLKVQENARRTAADLPLAGDPRMAFVLDGDCIVATGFASLRSQELCGTIAKEAMEAIYPTPKEEKE